MQFKFTALCVLGLGLASALPARAADDEATTAVPSRADANDPASEIYRATSVIGMPVRNDDGDEIGKIKDLVINGRSHEVLYAVVAMDDVKEPGSVYVMPWNVFQPSFTSASVIQFVTLGVPRSIWIQGPVFGWNEWQRMPFSKWGPQVNKHFAKYTNEENHHGTRTSQSDEKKDRDGDRSDKDSKRDESGTANQGDKKAPKDAPAPKENTKPAPKPGNSPPAKGGSAPAPKEIKGSPKG